MCFLLKSFLNSHSGFNRDDLQNYLNLFSFIVNAPYNKLEKVKILLDKAICNPKHYIIEISTPKKTINKGFSYK